MKSRIIGEEKLNEFVKMIIEKAENEAKRIIEEAEKKAAKEIEKAKLRAEEEIDRRVNQFITSMEENSKRKIAEAKLEAKRIILEAKEKAILKVLNKLKDKLRELKNKPDYVNIIGKLIHEAGVALGGGDLIIELNEDHKNININWDEISREIEESTKRSTKLTIQYRNVSEIGGAIVRTSDGKFSFDNTFEGRIERMEKTLRLLIAKKLFG